MPHPYTYELEIAINAVTKAAILCRRIRTEMINPDAFEKTDHSPVTVADFGSQALVCHELLAAFPTDVIVGEEESDDLHRPSNAPILAQITDYVQAFYPTATPDQICAWIDTGTADVAYRYWTLDPIDGTKGFLRNDQYAVALALIENGQVKLGVLACPALPLEIDNPYSPCGVIFTAVRNHGAMMAPLGSQQFTPIHVTTADTFTGIRFTESIESSHSDLTLQQLIANTLGITQPALRMDSQVKYGVLARGDAGLYLRLPSPQSPLYREKVWDHAAGSIIIEEAGGRVTDMYGYPLDFATDYRMHHNRGIIVSNGILHNAVIKAIKETGL